MKILRDYLFASHALTDYSGVFVNPETRDGGREEGFGEEFGKHEGI
jgi:hypothetical protein